jgi:cell division protein FtsA
MSNIITGLDIGTGTIKGLAVVKRQNASGFDVAAQAEKHSLGIRKGTIMDSEEVSKNIKWVLNNLQQKCEDRIENVYVNLNGGHIFCLSSRGSVVISRADQKISQEDIDRVIESAKTFSLAKNNEILSVFPKEYIVDDQKKIKKPLGIKGVRLETEVVVLCAFAPYIKNLTEAVLNSELQIEDIVPSALAAGKAVLSDEQKELGVVVVDIGAGSTSLAVYNEGDLIHSAVIPIGSSLITQDIAIGLQTEIDVAEEIKNKFGSCALTSSNKNKKEKIDVEGSSPLVFSRKMLEHIVKSRVSEIFSLVQKELKKISPQPTLPAGIVLTGGGAKISKIVDLAKKEFKLPVKIGRPKFFSELNEDTRMSVLCGLAMEGADAMDQESDKRIRVPNIFKQILEKLKKFLKSFIP